MPTAATDNAAASKRSAFRARLFSTILLWIILGTAMWFGHMPTVVGIAMLLGIAGSLEYAGVLQHADETHSRRHAILVVIAGLAWWMVVWSRPDWSVPGWLDFVIMFAATQVAFLLCYNTDVATQGQQVLRRLLSSVFGVFYTVVLYGYLVRIIFLGSDKTTTDIHGISLLLYVIAVTKFSDMGAYAVGSLISSNHFMCPKISPKKTWEGFVGAFIGGFVASCTLLWAMPQMLQPITWSRSFILVPLLILLAVTGDLAESILKRCLHVKDAGHKLPGIGGILDLTDSLLYTTPAFYGYVIWCLE